MDPVGLLLGGGADANAQSIESRDTPLHLAAQHGHYDVVALLVQHRVGEKLGRIKKGGGSCFFSVIKLTFYSGPKIDKQYF